MEPKRRLLYVDIRYKCVDRGKQQPVKIRERDWFPRIRPQLRRIYREAIA